MDAVRRRTIGCILAVFFFLGAYAYAQEWPSAAQIVEKVRTDLNLDQKQFDAVKLLIEKNMARRKLLGEESGRGLTLAQSEELRADLYTQLREVLTRYQMSQWNEMLRIIEEDADASESVNSHSQPLPLN